MGTEAGFSIVTRPASTSSGSETKASKNPQASRSHPGNRRRPRSRLVALSLLRFLLKMKHVSYNGYIITVTANNEKGTWRSHVIITWYAGKFDLHDEVCFTTEMEAEERAVESGKHWVNNRLQILKGSS